MSTPEGIQASDWHLFRDAVFGRDSAQVGLDVVGVFPHRAAAIVTSLAVRQGLHHDPRTEEEPGRIHHEWRSEWIGRVRTSPASVDIMRLLQSVWGDPDADTLCYYAPSTPRVSTSPSCAGWWRSWGRRSSRSRSDASREWAATAASLREATWARFAAPLPSGLCMALDRDPTTGAVRQGATAAV